jgi:hypothetical protein
MRRAAIASCVLLPIAAIVWWRSASPAPKRAVRPTAAVKARAAKTPPAAVAGVKPAPQPTVKKPAVKASAKPAPPPSPPAQPLANPPQIVKAVYFTGWSAGLKQRVDYLVDLHKTTAINAVVFDIKDYSGNIAYAVTVPAARQYGAVRVMIHDIDGLVNRLHREGIYVIARITVFQDPVLAEARPDLAVHRVSMLPKGRQGPLTAASLWRDRKGLAWIDPASRPAWEYILSIARDALGHGVDELNFDYVRFPSDGNLKDMYFPSWDGKTPKHKVIRQFFTYLRKQLPDVRISVDLFGLATVNQDDLGIGQVIEDAYATFDDVCPMVYPSHYARKFLGFPNPAEHPYEVVNYSLKEARTRLEEFSRPKPEPKVEKGGGSAAPDSGDTRETVIKAARLRPWIQDFNLGAKYDTAMVKAEIKAAEDALGDRFSGYMVWAPSNVYTRRALMETPKKTQTAEAHPSAVPDRLFPALDPPPLVPQRPMPVSEPASPAPQRPLPEPKPASPVPQS